jgi:hypothetical protein
VGVPDPRLEQDVEKAAEKWVPDVSVKPWHGSGLNVVHTISDDEIRTSLERTDKPWNLGEVISEVGIRHDHIFTARHRESSKVGAPITTSPFGDDQRAGIGCQLCAPILRCIVCDYDLAVDASADESRARRRDTSSDAPALIETRNHDGHGRRTSVEPSLAKRLVRKSNHESES